MNLIPRLVWSLLSVILLLNGYCGALFEARKKEEMISGLECIKRTMQVQYAPSDWKKEFLNWDLDAEFQQASNRIKMHPSITTKDFQNIVRQFLSSAQDYHVGVTFFSTESAVLPFSVKTVNGKSYIDWVDEAEWPSEQEMICKGDELIEFDGLPIQEVLNALKQSNGCLGNTATDQALVDHTLTLRLGASGDRVPRGALVLTTLSKSDGKINRSQLEWRHKPEKISSPFDFSFLAGDLWSAYLQKKPSLKDRIKASLKRHCMIAPLHQTRMLENQLRRGELGASKSFLPLLGHPIWIHDLKEAAPLKDQDSSMPDAIDWFAYIYKNEAGHSIGYLRIPHYSGEDEDIMNVVPLIAYLEKHTDALVIDQLNNPGGYAFFMYDLLSLLSPYPLFTPKHQVAINQREVMEALEEMDSLRFSLALNEGDQSAAMQNEQLRGLLDYYQFIVDEWNQGHALTQSTSIGGVDSIQPHPRVRYTKPILMLINELDFSAGDFSPAILQDNQRATLMGTRTAGAGGAVTQFSFPNRHGIKEVFFTDTIAERVNLQKIENFGVIPDIEYEVTDEDLRNDYQNYQAAINQAVADLIMKDRN